MVVNKVISTTVMVRSLLKRRIHYKLFSTFKYVRSTHPRKYCKGGIALFLVCRVHAVILKDFIWTSTTADKIFGQVKSFTKKPYMNTVYIISNWSNRKKRGEVNWIKNKNQTKRIGSKYTSKLSNNKRKKTFSADTILRNWTADDSTE